MKKKSASTLIYFFERERKKKLVKRPKHINKEKRANAVKWFFVAVVVLTVIGLGVWGYIKYQPLNITSVKISGAQRFVSAQDVQSIVEEKALGQNTLFIDTKSMEKTISANFLAAKSVKVKRQLPKSLKVEITERVPIALIQSAEKLSTTSVGDDAKDFYFVDNDGFVLGLADKSTTNLPVITYSQQVEVGKFVESSTVSYYFDLIKALEEDSISPSTISSYPRYTQFFTKEDIQVLVSNGQPAKSQVRILAKMMEAFKAEGRIPKKIDLRFDKVIVEFGNQVESEDKIKSVAATESLQESFRD